MKKINILKGGKSDNMSIEDIAKKHDKKGYYHIKNFVKFLKKELLKGINVEFEHTSNKSIAKEIAMNHLSEDPNYYSKLKKMEAKECTGADSSGSFESPFGTTILKRDIHKIHNFKSPINEMDGIPDMVYDAPIGHRQKDPLAIDNPSLKEVDDGPILGNKKLDSKANLKLPKWVKGGKYVGINKTPKNKIGRNSGDPKNYTLYENFILENNNVINAMNEASKKYSISLEEVKMIVAAKINESGIPKGIFDDLGNSKALSSWMNDTKPQKYRIKTKEPIDIIISGDAQLAKFKILFRQHDIDFSSYEISK